MRDIKDGDETQNIYSSLSEARPKSSSKIN